MARFCGNCGNELVEGDHFCRECGTGTQAIPAVSEAQRAAAEKQTLDDRTTQEAVTAAMPAAAPTGAASVASPRPAPAERPRWLIPVLVAAGLFLGVILLAGILVAGLSGEEKPDPLDQVAARELAPVATATGNLNNEAEAVANRSDLGSLSRASVRLTSASGQASAAISDSEVSEADSQAQGLLLDVLRETGDYGRALQAAADKPSAATLGDVRSQAEDVRDAEDALQRENPAVASTVQLRLASLEGVEQVLASDAKAAATHKRQASARQEARGYVAKIDSLLRNSSETRGDLGALIEDIRSGELTAAQSHTQITAILNQRQDLQNSISTVDVPPSFTHPAELLRSSIGASIADDKAIQGWITAWWEGDSYGIDRFWHQHLDATSRASSEKEAFVSAYNHARARIGVGPFSTGTNY